MSQGNRIPLKQIQDNCQRTSSPCNILRPLRGTEDLNRNQSSDLRSDDNDSRYRDVDIVLRLDSEERKENLQPGRWDTTFPTTPESTREDSQTTSRTPSPTQHYTSKNTIKSYRLKNEIVIENPRDGFPFLPLKNGTLVQVYYDSKHTNHCWITQDSWNFGWCIERTDLDDRPVYMSCCAGAKHIAPAYYEPTLLSPVLEESDCIGWTE